MSTHHRVSQLTWSHRALNLLFCAGGIIACYSLFSIFQEKITKKHYGENNERFTYMQALVFIQCAVNTFVAFFAKEYGQGDEPSLDNVPFHLYSLCSTSYFLAMLFSNLALEWVNYPTQVLGKSCKPIPIMIFGVIFAGKRYACRKYLYVLLIVIGMAVFLYKEDRKSKTDFFQFGTGEMMVVLSLAMDGVTGATQDKIRHNYHTEKWSMMFFMNLFSSVFLAVTLATTGELWKFFDFVQAYPYVLQEMVLFAIAGAMGQCFIFKTVTDFGPLTCSIVTTLRKLFSLVVSILLFNHPYTSRHIIATGIVFTALILDALESRRSYKPYKPLMDQSDEKDS